MNSTETTKPASPKPAAAPTNYPPDIRQTAIGVYAQKIASGVLRTMQPEFVAAESIKEAIAFEVAWRKLTNQNAE